MPVLTPELTPVLVLGHCRASFDEKLAREDRPSSMAKFYNHMILLRRIEVRNFWNPSTAYLERRTAQGIFTSGIRGTRTIKLSVQI